MWVGQRHANAIATPSRHPAQAKELELLSGAPPKRKGQSEGTLDPIYFPSIEAVNSIDRARRSLMIKSCDFVGPQVWRL